MLSIENMGADLQVDDVEAYLSARNIAARTDSPDVTEYWKSTPYLLSFMEQYRLAERVKNAVEEDPAGPVAELIRNNPQPPVEPGGYRGPERGPRRKRAHESVSE